VFGGHRGSLGAGLQRGARARVSGSEGRAWRHSMFEGWPARVRGQEGGAQVPRMFPRKRRGQEGVLGC
jgi:hypothetical protein